MEKSKKVSILIPVYNREKLVCRAIESAMNQTYKNIEIIIVDNCSQDNTYNVCKLYEEKDDRIKVYKNSENIGPVKNWLKCLEYSHGYYSKIIYSDDWISKNYIEECMNNIKDDIAFIISKAYVHTDKNESIKVLYNLDNENYIFSKSYFIEKSILGEEFPVSPGCAFFRTEDLKKNLIEYIPNNEGVKFGAGNDLLIYLFTLLDNKYEKIKYLNNIRAHFLSHNQSFTIANNLKIYYDWTKLYFLSIYRDKLLEEKFKSCLLYNMTINSEYKKLYNMLKCDNNIDQIYKIIKKDQDIKEIYRLKSSFFEKLSEKLALDINISERIIKELGYTKISIYGMGSIGTILYKKIKKENVIKIEYCIDENIPKYCKMKEYIKRYNNELLIITPFYYYDFIVDSIKENNDKIRCISVNELIK